VPVEAGEKPAADGVRAVLGADPLGVAGAAAVHPDLASLAAAVDAGKLATPAVVVTYGGDAPDPDAFDSMLRQWGSDQKWESSRLVVATEGAVHIPGEDDGAEPAPDPSGVAEIWGMVRAAAASERRDRFVLVDLPVGSAQGAGAPDGRAALLAAFEASAEEPELAVRDGGVYVRRLLRATAPADASEPSVPAPPSQSTLLVTGSNEALGAAVAEHLVATDQASNLRRVLWAAAPAAGSAVVRSAARLAEQGVEAQVFAADIAVRDELAAVLGAIPQDLPLRRLVHVGGPAGAARLDALTRGLDLDAFVLISSAAEVYADGGTAGAQGAANLQFEAIAGRRRAAGLPATSFAWGGRGPEPGDEQSPGTAADAARWFKALTEPECLAMLDTALAWNTVSPVSARLDAAGLRAHTTRGGRAPALLRRLSAGGVTVPTASSAGRDGAPAAGVADALRRRLSGLTELDRERVLLDLVRANVAAVLGHDSVDAVEPQRAFREIGFDSLTSVELRNRLNTATGLRLPATLVFDHPTSNSLAGMLRGELLPETDGDQDSDDEKVRRALASVPLSRLRDAGLIEVLLRLADSAEGYTHTAGSDAGRGVEAIDSLDAENLVRLAMESGEGDF
jgi:candicidin polyketide synthase FscB